MSPTIIAQLLALPSLRKQAEVDARAYAVAYGDDVVVGQDIGVQIKLLADFTRWQSQAWALRRIGEILGWNIGDTVPGFSTPINGVHVLVEIECDGMWEMFASTDMTNATTLPGLPADRAGALAAILLHLEGTQ